MSARRQMRDEMVFQNGGGRPWNGRMTPSEIGDGRMAIPDEKYEVNKNKWEVGIKIEGQVGSQSRWERGPKRNIRRREVIQTIGEKFTPKTGMR